MPANTPPCVRFAPSPNGYLHLGHAYSALTAFAIAQRTSNRFLLRIEDIDVARTREEFVTAIFEDLNWLGLSWPEPVLRQQHRFKAYAQATRRLTELGVLYSCFATRKEIASASSDAKTKRDPDGAPLYPGLYRDLSAEDAQSMKDEGRPFALRLNMEKAINLAHAKLGETNLTFTEQDQSGNQQIIKANPQRWGDAVIVRKDTPTSYHLAVVLDDAYQNVTLITRGRDLLASTDIHRLLQVLLDLPEPNYHHHALIEDDEGLKLSKSKIATSLRSLRESGWTPQDITNHLKLDTIL